MRIAVIGAGVSPASSPRYRLTRGRATRSTSTSAGPGSAARRRRSTSAAGTGSSATTTTCSPPTATSRRCTTSSGCADELEWRESTVAMLRARPPVAVHHADGPAALQAAAAAGARADGRAPCWRSSASPGNPSAVRADHRAQAWIERWMGRGRLARGVGAAAARQVRRRAPTTSRWSGCGTSCGCGAARTPPRSSLGYPRQLVGAAARGAARPRSRPRGGRVLIDRPAARIAPRRRLRGHAAARPGSFRAGHDPREFAPAASPSATTRVLATVPSDVFEQLARARRAARGLPRAARAIEYFAALCLLLELDRQFTPYYWTNVADRRAAVRRADRAHELRSSPSATTAAASSTSPTTSRTATRCSTSTPRRCWRATRRACGAVNPAFERGWVRSSSGASPSRPPSRSSRSATASGSRRWRPASRACVLANTTQIYPEDRGTNYAVRLGDEAARAVLAVS